MPDGFDAPPLKRQGLFLCEAEIARRLSQSERHWRGIVRELERQGLPKIDTLMGGRYWPAVKAFMDRRCGISPEHDIGPGHAIVTAAPADGDEHWDAA